MQPIIPTRGADPFDDPACLFEIKLDGFRALADTLAARFISKNGNALKRFAAFLDTLPPGYVFDGEIVALDDDGDPCSTIYCSDAASQCSCRSMCWLRMGRMCALPLRDRKALLTKIVRRYRLQKLDWVIGEGTAAFEAVCDLDLEGIVAKRMTDAYVPGKTRWWKVLNRSYSQKARRAELFERRYG
jgi:ATP-dependent DNA ligase